MSYDQNSLFESSFDIAASLPPFSGVKRPNLSQGMLIRGRFFRKLAWCLILLSGLLSRPLAAQSGVTSNASLSGDDGLPITYHGGHVMQGPHDVYFIWYGNWRGNTALSILPDFVNGLNGSPYFNINTTYTDNTGGRVDNIVALSGQAFDSYSQGSSLTAVQVFDVVNRALVNGALPYDAQGIYFVLTSRDVTQTSLPTGGSDFFCEQAMTGYCGWHYSGAFEGRLGRIAFVGDPSTQCPATATFRCSEQSVTPNGNEGADAMANVIAHELSEAVTDPDLTAWYDSKNEEVGDKCSFNFGPSQFTLPNGARANITLGARSFLTQQLWLNVNAGSCAISFGMLPNWWPAIQQLLD